MTGKELQALLADHQCFHSAYQIDHFILAKEGGTPYGCYKQALRELSKRYRGLKGLLIDRALLTVGIDELEEDIKDTEALVARREADSAKMPGSWKYDLCRKYLHLEQKKMQMDGLERTLKDTCREFARFYAHAKTLKAQLEELTPENRAKLDEEMWEHRLKSQMALDLLSVGHIRGETIATVQTMPEEFRKAARDALSVQNGDRYKQHEVVDWYLNLEPVVLEDKELMPPEEVMKFLQEGS